jgi:hypothetical protein
MKPKLSTKEHNALLLFREATEGGDPFMAHVSIATVQKLIKKGLIRRHNKQEALTLKRHHVVTPEGRAWLDAQTLGPSQVSP